MILNRLKLRNFLIFKDVDLDLSKVKLTSVIGRYVNNSRRSNGSGKTALVEAIRYALFDQTRSKQKLGIVRSGSDNCVVELEFSVNNHHLKVYRSRTSNGTSAAKVWVDGKVSGEKINVVNTVIKSYIGIDAELFDVVYFFKQRDQFGFTEALPSERKAILGKVFKMDDLEKCLQIAKTRYTDAESASQRAEGYLNALKSRLSCMHTEDELVESLLESGDEVSRCSYRLGRLDMRVHAYQGTLDEFDANVREFNSDVASVLQEAEDAYDQAQELINEIACIQATLQQKSSLLEGLRNNRDKFKEIIGDRAEDVDGYSIALQSAERKKSELIQAKADQQAIINKKSPQLADIAEEICPTCQQRVPIEHIRNVQSIRARELASATDLIAKISSEIEQICVKIAEHRESIRRVERKNSARAQLESVMGHLTTLEKDEKDGLKKIAELQRRRDELLLKHSRATVGIDDSEVQGVRRRLSEIRVAMDSLCDISSKSRDEYILKLKNAEIALSNADRDLREYLELDAQISESIGSCHAIKQELKVYRHLVEAFGKNGVQAILIDNAIGLIEQFANEILSQMQTKFSVSMRTQRETKAGEQRETLDIVVYDNGCERPFENYSGGEQTLINLSIRLALSRIIGSLRGIRMQSLFLDEVLAELDGVNREEAIKVVAFLAKSFEQVFVISHTDEVKNIIGNAILIERHDAHSEVRLADGR